ncbi:MAG: hypothetical protein CSB24_02130 [Deltaproteobacteria bacterium]|nr:MAG: hypothetical protein CSB24_02130 [Deltaproteobacteria bacterium]
MNPIRILIIAALLYAVYRLTFGSGKKNKDSRKGGGGVSPRLAEGVEDVLVEDPVCHSLVPKHQAVQLEHEQRIVYFCSDECCRKFIAEKRS